MTDNSRNERQARRREREKQWLKVNGWRSWEALHTALMSSAVCLVSRVAEEPRVLDNRQIFDLTDQG
jgi:hypothetical protein